ncbi:hypothetical protein [Caenimonas soli]|uniref:hypothetical protein n=1 Tax=Caenimonas soli TaxID=2735555 RepID=UPI001552AEAF|nr:hypothetical protein [Caenimonas soli]NPC57840.1 hypothetical protein [Caenimonas soli]
MTAAAKTSPSPTSTRLSILGAGLIALAFIAPYVGAAIGIGEASAFQAGQDIARTLGSLLFLAFIAWAVTRGRSDSTKAAARVVVGVLLCAVVASNIASAASDAAAVKAYVVETVQFRDAQAAKFSKLGERFDSIDLTKVLTPQSVATPPGQAIARALLANYRALLAERRALLQTYLLEFERFVNERAPSGNARAAAMAAMKEKKDQTVTLYAALDEAQGGLADSMERVLDWGAAQGGRLGVQNGQLLFTDVRQQGELSALAAQVTEAEKKFNATLLTTQAAHSQAQADMVDQNRRVQEFLKK